MPGENLLDFIHRRIRITGGNPEGVVISEQRDQAVMIEKGLGKPVENGGVQSPEQNIDITQLQVVALGQGAV